jgi:hypothetical protein
VYSSLDVHGSSVRAPFLLLHGAGLRRRLLNSLHGVDYLLDPLRVNHLKWLKGAVVLPADDGHSAVGAGQLLALQSLLNGREGILDELLWGVVVVALEPALEESLGSLGARTDGKCLVLKVVPAGAVVIEMSSRLIQSSNKEANTIRPLP